MVPRCTCGPEGQIVEMFPRSFCDMKAARRCSDVAPRALRDGAPLRYPPIMIDQATMEQARDLIARLRAAKVKVGTAESLTGGLIAAMLTSVPGASEVVEQCVVTYSWEAKQSLLGVPRALLEGRRRGERGGGRGGWPSGSSRAPQGGSSSPLRSPASRARGPRRGSPRAWCTSRWRG